MNHNSTEQNIGWFRDRYLEGSLTIKPPYQRKPVWKARQKCYLVESILMGLPVPEIYIQQTVSSNDKTQYAIVDGQQRMRAILQFIGVEREDAETEYNQYNLDQLDVTSPWSNFTFTKLNADQRKRFIGHRMAVRYLNTENEDEIRDLFQRLNRYLTPLKAQELRNATYSGPFVTLVNKKADDEYWAENRIVTADAIRRMGDVEFVSELFIGLLHGPQGGASHIIDDYYAQYEDYEGEFPNQKTITKLFDESLEIVKSLFPDIKQTRWSNKTDYYSMFVAIGNLLKTKKLHADKYSLLSSFLMDFATQVDSRMSNEAADVSAEVVEYVQALVRGANDKSRRAARHAALSQVIETHFVERRTRSSIIT
jgi:hypothetical protein